MATENNIYAFCADYSNLSACLFAIQSAQENDVFSGDQLLVSMLNQLEKDTLRKLYLRTIRLLGVLYQVEGVPQTYIGGDFRSTDFKANDFNVGYLQAGGTPTDLSAYLAGDFEDEDFTHLDFWVGFQDLEEAGYASVFKTITNIFSELCSRSSEISNGEKWTLDAALLPFLDAADEIKAYLKDKGLNLCTEEENIHNNDSGVFLQASGSDGSKGVAAGLHLRWALTGELGENHLPKGDYYNSRTPQGLFNRANDYVRIFRTEYVTPVIVNLDFEAKRPVINFASKSWSYLLTNTAGQKKISNRLRITFEDAQAYNQLASALDPQLYFYDFLNRYPGIIKIEILEKSVFRFGFDFTANIASDSLKVEGNCYAGDDVDNAQTVRKTIISTGVNELLADNIRTIRIKKTRPGILKSISFETYSDFIELRTESDWTEIGSGFGLSLNDAEVYSRLERPEYPINNLWPQYNQGTRVRVSNYQEKWSITSPAEPSLKDALLTYLTLSETDSRALDTIKKAGATPLDEGFEISYVDVLNLQASDYHIARMFGLGCIDAAQSANSSLKYIYQLRYLNRRGIADSSFLEHRYTTLPVSKSDDRLPEKPAIAPVAYGLPNPEISGNGVFDASGYTPLDRVRAINIQRDLYGDENLSPDFFLSLSAVENENIFEHPKAVGYGIEYRAAGAANYQKPEIIQDKSLGKLFYAYDDDYPVQGVVETALVPDDERSLYVHFERHSGVHAYAIYGVNWFSRASVLSDEVLTDATIFPKINTLVPPDNLAVQYIQKEQNPVVTTSREQGWLTERESVFPGQDTALTRVTFNYTDIIDVSYFNSADEALDIVKASEFGAFFNDELPLQISGQIKYIKPFLNTGTHLVLQLGSYVQINGELASPQLSQQDFFRFNDAILSTPQGQFRVVQVRNEQPLPQLIIEKNKIYETISDPELSDNYGVGTKYASPETGARFTMTENLSKAANWSPLSAKVNAYSFADVNNPVIETLTDSEGNISRFWIGGINEPAIITPLFGPGSAENIEGLYKISFNSSFVLPPHPQSTPPYDENNPGGNPPGTQHAPFVEWYKGTVRVLTPGASERKTLEVLRIDDSNGLSLYVLDPDYQQEPIVISADQNDPISVNFHPGYRVYYFSEPIGIFNRSHILPVGGENQRKTLMALQAVDANAGGSGFSSTVSLPAVLMAREVIEPIIPDAPVISSQRMRADATGKASLTFDTKVLTLKDGKARNPFGFSFYRISAQQVISALYEAATAGVIYQHLAGLSEDNFADQRFYELVNLVFDDEQPGQFNVFAALPEPYGFPVPDKAGLVNSGDALSVKKQKYFSAIVANLLPLNQQVPIFSFIKTGYQTENIAPVIRNLDGNLLPVTSPDFNPFPMVRKFTKTDQPGYTFIRFTDYFLYESSRDSYFYTATETTNELINGDLSPFSGPVSIINSVPPGMPLLAGLRINPSVKGGQITVDFILNPIAAVDEVSKIRIYRSLSLSELERPVNSAPFFEVSVSSSLMGFEITDDFQDFFAIPYGETLYYRFYAVRTIINELNDTEDILSPGSAITSVKLIDTRNPEAPELFFNQQDNLLYWSPSVTDGNYSLYQQTNRGNWQRIFSASAMGTQPIEYPLPENMSFTDEDGNRVYYRFKVRVENSSGLSNLQEKELTI